MTDFNLETEYGYFIQAVQTRIDELDSVEHSGVKGMKWGIRKRDTSKNLTSLGPEEVTVTTKKGDKVTLSKVPTPAIANFIGRRSERYRAEMAKTATMTIHDSKGKRVGDCEVYRKSDDEINLVWLGIDKSQRGNGYASATMQAAVDFGKQVGVKKLTLEVPGNSPDAEHIYSKLGFVHKGIEQGSEKDIWGGLYMMEYNFADHDKVKHAEDWIEHSGVKGMKWGVRKRANHLVEKARGGPKEAASEDAVKAQTLRKKVKTSSTAALSNKELQDLVTRLNLEQQYSRLTNGDKSPAQKFLADTLVNIGKQQLTKIANDQASAQVESLLKKK